MRFRWSLAPQSRVVPRFYEVAAIVAVLLTLTTVQADADDFNIVPSLGVKLEYNDNIYYSADKTGDLRSSIMPGLELKERNERLDAGLLATLKGIKSLKDSRFDTVDFHFDGRLRYQSTPRLSVSATAVYDRDSNPSQENSQIAVVTNLVRLYQQQYSLQSEYAISNRTSGALAYSYSQYDYVTVPLQSNIQGASPPAPGPLPPPNPNPGPNPNPNPPPTPPPTLLKEVILSSPDVKIDNPSLRLSHSFDELTKGSLDAGYTRFLYKYSTVDNYTVTLGLSRALNELWNLSASAGGRFTQSEFTPVKRTFSFFPSTYTDQNQAPEKSQGYGWVGQLALAYSGQYSSVALSLFRDVAIGRLSANERTGVSLDTSYRFSNDVDPAYGFMKAFEVNFNAGYQLNHAGRGQFASEAVDDTIVRLRAGVRYDFTKDISLDGGYTKTIANYSSIRVDQNYAYLNLLIKCPLF